MLSVVIEFARANTVLYCRRWEEAVAFYRDRLGLTVSFENEWFIEFEVGPGSYVSVADASHASIAPGDGRGITLSWQVADVDAARTQLIARGVAVSEIGHRFGSPVIDLFDPAGNRIELWSPSAR